MYCSKISEELVLNRNVRTYLYRFHIRSLENVLRSTLPVKTKGNMC